MQSSPAIEGFPLPANPDVVETVCYQVHIPNDPAYIAAFLGVMYDMSLWISWQRDEAHTGIRAAQRMKQVYNQISSGAAGCDVTQLRLKPGNHCIIQVTNDGTTWTDEIDLSLCATETTNGILNQRFPPNNPPGRSQPGDQPGGGSPTPGQCFDLDMTVKANQLNTIPVAIASGWQITISNPNGIWSEGNTILSLWAIYNGDQFFAGAIESPLPTDPADPLPTSPHMALLLSMPGGTYAALTAGVPFVVPDGLSAGNYYLLANDHILGDNAGEITMHVQACDTASSVDLSYTNGGHGPISATLNVEFTFTITSVGSPRPWASGEIYFSRCVTLEFVTVTGWSSDPDDPNNYAFRDCTGTWGSGVSGHPADGHSEPNINGYGQNSGTDMTIVAKVTHIG